MKRSLHTARLLAPLMVLVLSTSGLAPVVHQLCRQEAPVTACCPSHCGTHQEAESNSEMQLDRGPVAKPCCIPATEASAPAVVVPAPVQPHLVLTAVVLDAPDLAAHLAQRVVHTADHAPPPAVRPHLSNLVLLI